MKLRANIRKYQKEASKKIYNSNKNNQKAEKKDRIISLINYSKQLKLEKLQKIKIRFLQDGEYKNVQYNLIKNKKVIQASVTAEQQFFESLRQIHQKLSNSLLITSRNRLSTKNLQM